MMQNSSSASSRAAVDRTARTTKKRISDDEWNSHKESIERLYLDDGRDVREVRDTMKREYGFEAHEKAYKRKFEEWGLIKNIPKEEGLFMVKKRERRREEEDKETTFRRRRRPGGPLQLVPDEKVDRIADRYSHDLNSYPEHPGTPENVEYDTPDDTPGGDGPRPPHQAERSVPNSGPDWSFPPIPEHPPVPPQYFVPTQNVEQHMGEQRQPQNQLPNPHWGPWGGVGGTGGQYF